MTTNESGGQQPQTGPVPPATPTTETAAWAVAHKDTLVSLAGKADNPARNGRTGRTSVYLTFGGLGLFGLFLLLDAVQFIVTGHESSIFLAIARGVGGLGIGSLLVTLYKSYFVKEK